MNLTEFLEARIAEDEAVARAASEQEPWSVGGYRGSNEFYASVYVDAPFAAVADYETAEHIARWNPARVLAECEAKRRIVEAYQRTQVADFVANAGYQVAGGVVHAYRTALRLLALPYADHPDYDESWRP